MTAFVNAVIVQPDHLIPDGVMLVENGRIRDFGEARSLPAPENARRIDLEGAFVGPGLIDIHTHAGDGAFFYEDPQRACAFHLKNGTTTLLPALYYNMTGGQWLDAVALLKRERERGAARIISGLYMEGPYLNPAFGAEADNNRWKAAVRREDYLPLVEAAGDFARIWCIAPEREGIESYVDDVRAKSPGAIFAVAHSKASPQEVERFVPLGLRVGTHHTNATGDLPKYPECRGVCVDETVNYNDDIYAELICDSRGIHVDPYMLRLVRKLKGPDRLILISDHFACDGPIPPGYEGVDDINFDLAGEIAGSKLSLSKACRNMMVHTGCSVCDAFRFASLNPARLLGLTDRGVIRRGARADLIVTGPLMDVRHVFLAGEAIK